MAIPEELQQGVPRPVRPRSGWPSMGAQKFRSLLLFLPFLGFGLLMAYYSASGALRMSLLATSPRQVQARVVGIRVEPEATEVKLHYSVEGEGFVKRVHLSQPSESLQDGDLLTIDYAPGFPAQIRVPGQQPESWLMLGVFGAFTILWNAAIVWAWTGSWAMRRHQQKLIQLGEAVEGEVVDRQEVVRNGSSGSYLVVRSADGDSHRIRTSCHSLHRPGSQVTLLRDKAGVAIYEDCGDESFVVPTQAMI